MSALENLPHFNSQIRTHIGDWPEISFNTTMGFFRQVLTGRLPSGRRRQREPEQQEPEKETPAPRHALDTLPSLPIPRRPITPIPPDPQQQQLPPSHFFRLPPEIRQQIYRLVLAGREIHLDMRYTAAETTTPHSTQGASLSPHGRRWQWHASTCHRHPAAQPLVDRCTWGGGPPTACHLYSSYSSSPAGGSTTAENDTWCGVGPEVLGLLLSCRLAYRECVGLVYGENVLHIGTGALVLHTDRLLPPSRAADVRKLVLRVTEKSVWDYADEHLGIRPAGLHAYRVLLGRLPLAFPRVRSLMVVVHGSLEWGQVHWGRGERDPLDPVAVRDCLLEAMDAVVRGFGGGLGECILAMGHTAFDRVMDGEKTSADKVEEGEGMWLQFWRPVTVTRMKEGDPSPVVDTGYWIRRVSPWEVDDPVLMQLSL